MSMYRRCLNRLTPDVVCWISYGDRRSFREFEVIPLFSGHLRWGPLIVIHRPERVVRQFGYVQTITPHPIAPSISVEEMDDRWMQFGDYIALVGQICVVPDQCSSDYMDWFYMILHSFMTPTQPGDPPRVPPVQEYDIFFEPDMHQQSVATAAPDEVDVDVHRAGHVVDGYVTIADKLDRLLNLRILTEGTKAYIVAEECITIARSYIGQPTIGHRSRRRRRTNEH
ncbi:uncharacterized protein [Glycine max]|uniref:uncharacterized protein n=1 Tax=Glycine max TaxID=3847 RepID=UPI0003DE8FC9|nr:uncharacterized protein LOC102663740 [Glycine max]|eukprot:XP_006582530.1 uncharacterized protein LOC102663740 [Glycine max]